MESSLLIAGVIALILFAVFFYLKLGLKHSNSIQVKIGNKTVKAEVADTLLKQVKGLMGVKNLPEDQGMLFVFSSPGSHKFWMFNTSIPLDIIWIDSDKAIIYIQQNAQPCMLMNCTTYGPDEPSNYVLEVNANYTVKNKISVGDKVEFNLS